MSAADTIFALSSAPGIAGIAVVRVSGPDAPAVAAELGLGRLAQRRASVTRISDPRTGELIDKGIAILFRRPASFTGESVLELHVHGGRAVVAALLAALSSIPGCRLAEAGEFTRRAFHNGKLDLTGAEGLAALLGAETEVQRKSALRVAGGELRTLYDGWRSELIEAMALMEAAIDFSDEADVANDALAQARTRVAALRSNVETHLNDNRRGEILRDGLKVVLAGPPNAGKSSLLNALARRDVAIVSPEPGTTRDVVEARLDLDGYPVIVSDTAGIRPDPGGAIEREGIRRTYERSAEADLVLWLIDSTNPVYDPPAELIGGPASVIPVSTKWDLDGNDIGPSTLRISTKTGQGLDGLLAILTACARDRIGDGGSAAIITSRQRALLIETTRFLATFLAGNPDHIELRAEDLRQAAQSLGRLTGRVDVEDVLDRVFSSFCIGK